MGVGDLWRAGAWFEGKLGTSNVGVGMGVGLVLKGDKYRTIISFCFKERMRGMTRKDVVSDKDN